MSLPCLSEETLAQTLRNVGDLRVRMNVFSIMDEHEPLEARTEISRKAPTVPRVPVLNLCPKEVL